MNKRGILLIIILLIPSVSALDVSIENNVLIVNGIEYGRDIEVFKEGSVDSLKIMF